MTLHSLVLVAKIKLQFKCDWVTGKQHRDDVSIIQSIRRIQIGKKKKDVLEKKSGVTGVIANLQKGNIKKAL